MIPKVESRAMDREAVKIIDGPFAGYDGEIVSVDAEEMTVEVMFFGRATSVRLRSHQFERPDGVESTEERIGRLRDRVAREHADMVGLRKTDFFLERVDLPEEDLAAEWHEFLAYSADVATHAEETTAAVLARFDEEIASLPAREAIARIDADPERWLPAKTARARFRARHPEEFSAELRLIGGSPSRIERVGDRHRRARTAADLRDYDVWKASIRSEEQRARDRLDAEATVARHRPAIEDRFARDWGIELPDSIFRLWAFFLSCGPIERQTLDAIEMRPFGIMDLFEDPARRPRDGIDVRTHGRYYRDPPEFLTFMHGGSDGLHFGLWYDDGRTCSGVASYYNNDGGGVGMPGGTPLEAIREIVELVWRDRDDPAFFGEDDDDPTGPRDPERVRRRHELRLLREHLMDFETGDRPEEGDEYQDGHRPPQAMFDHGDPDRAETLDGGGALVSGTTAIARKRQTPHGDHEFYTALYNELTEDAVALEEHVAEARRRCMAGNPADALTLGRDLHWISAGDPERERYAAELLVMAYRALGRDNLAAIAEAHHRHRDLPRVDVLRQE
jgi:hypothetical protein